MKAPQVFTRTLESEMHPSLSLRASTAAAAVSPSPSSAPLFLDALRGAAPVPGILLLSRPKHRGKDDSLTTWSLIALLWMRKYSMVGWQGVWQQVLTFKLNQPKSIIRIQ